MIRTYPYFKTVCVSVILALAYVLNFGVNSGHSQATETNRPVPTQFAARLLVECPDLRLGFYPSWEVLMEAQRDGSCLLIPDGVFEHAIKFRTNECSTVEVALKCYATNHIGMYYQTKVVQKNEVFQTPLGVAARSEMRSAVLSIRLQGGDVVIVSGKE